MRVKRSCPGCGGMRCRRRRAGQHRDSAYTRSAVRHSSCPLSANVRMTRPRATRYQPKPTKVWVLTKRSSQRTTRRAARAATTVPTATMAQSVGSAPGMPQAPRRLERASGEQRRQAHQERELGGRGPAQPQAQRHERMVAAEREVPGNMPARSWAMPTATAIAHVTSAAIVRPRSQRSAARITTPPRSVAQATGPRSSAGSNRGGLHREQPPTPVMTTAMRSLPRNERRRPAHSRRARGRRAGPRTPRSAPRTCPTGSRC